MQKASETVLEINLNALDHNYNYLRSKIKTKTKLLAVVKAFGYGSESVAIAQELEKLKVDYFAVAYAGEGVTLRDNQVQTPILVLHPLPVNFEMIVERCLEPSIYSLKMLKEFIAYSEENKLEKYPIHLKFNTGLNRLGFTSEDISEILNLLKNTKSITVRSMLSHLAATEDLNEREYTLKQISLFKTISDKMIEGLGYQPILHILNTSGIINYPEAQFDMVRTGIGLYGFGNDAEENKKLIPISTLKTVISQIHHIKKGESVGYNRAFIASENTTTATLPIGHADGIPRSYGKGKGWVSINGKKAPIVGNVCMDMIMVNITNIDCAEGDEVIVFGENPTAEELSKQIGSIPYELLTAVSQRIKRVVCRN